MLNQEMKSCIFFLVFAVSSLTVSPQLQTCPTDHFSAIFVGTVDKISSGRRGFGNTDPELKFFKEILGFRDDAIQHTIEDALKFFNDTYGLDFFPSAPNDLNQRFFENAIMESVAFSEDIKFFATTNNWIRTGNTRSTCNRIRHGGFRVRFSGDQTLYGSYGGAEGKPAGPISYRFYIIDGCQQSPIIIQAQCFPFRPEPIDGYGVFRCELYNSFLGHGNVQGVSSIMPIPDKPGEFRLTIRDMFTFPA